MAKVKKLNGNKWLFSLFAAVIIGCGLGYFFGYDVGYEKAAQTQIEDNKSNESSNSTSDKPLINDYFNNPQRIAKFFYQDYIQFMNGQKIKSNVQNPTTNYLMNSIFTSNQLNNLTHEEVACSPELPDSASVDDNPPPISHGAANTNVTLNFPNDSQKQVDVSLIFDESNLRWKINAIQCL